MNTRELLTVIIHGDKNATVKNIEKTVKSLHGEKLAHPLQIVVVVEGMEKSKFQARKRGYTMEQASSMEEVEVRGKYVNVLEAGDEWDAGSLANIEEYISLHKTNLIEEDTRRTPDKKDVIVRFTVSEAATFVTSLSTVWVEKSYYKKVCEIVKASKIRQVQLIAELYMSIGTYLSVPDIHVKQKNNKLVVEKEWFTGELEQVADSLYKASMENNQGVTAFVEYAIMHLIAACFKSPLYDALSQSEQESFREFLAQILDKMDDIIISKGGLNAALRMFVFEYKYGKQVWDEIKIRRERVKFENLLIFNFENAKIIKKINKKTVHGMTEVEVMIANPIESECVYYAVDESGNHYPMTKGSVDEKSAVTCMGKTIMQTICYSVQIPSEHVGHLEYEYQFKELYSGRMRMKEKA